MKKIAFLIVTFIALGLILVPVLAGSVSINEGNQSFSPDMTSPLLAAMISFVLAAILSFVCLNSLGKQRGRVSKPIIFCSGMVGFGLFYALAIIYKDAADVLSNYLIAWGYQAGMKEPMMEYMPEYIDIFSEMAMRYFILTGISLLVIVYGAYKEYHNFKK